MVIGLVRIEPPPAPSDSPHPAHSRLLASAFLSSAERRALEAELALPESLAPNTELMRDGTPLDRLFIVTDGWLCRYATTREGGRQITGLLLPGDIGNLDALLPSGADYGISSLTTATIVTLSRDRLLWLAAQHSGIGRTLTWLVLIENAVLSTWAVSLGRRSARGRFAHLICELSVRLGAEHANTSRFSLPMKQEQLADALGLTSVHVNRTMQQLRGEGLIETSGRTMSLPDVAGLRDVGGFDPHYLHRAPLPVQPV